MMRFYRNLYLSPNIRHPGVLKWRLRHNAGNLAVYVLMLSGDDPASRPGENQLEFCHCVFLHQPYMRRRNPMIIGIAEGRLQAFEMVRKIVQECHDATGGFDLKRYLFPEENGVL